MNLSSLLILFSCLFIFSCHLNEIPPKNAEATVVYLDPGPCCSNMEIVGGEQIFGDLVGYSESILAATNIEDFLSLGFENGDTLKIEYIFSEEDFPCNIDCNRHHGIRIELTEVTIL